MPKSVDWKLPIEFDFTARDTPQQNSLAEVSLATIANRGRALMAAAAVPEAVRRRIWNEAFKTATLLDGLIPVEVNGKTASRFVHWMGSNPKFAKHLRVWGEAGTVKVRTKVWPKLKDRGIPCMFVGYALGHPGDCYRMFNPKTNGIHETRDIIWLKRMFYQVPVPEPEVFANAEAASDDDEPAQDIIAFEDGKGDSDTHPSTGDDGDEPSDEDSDYEPPGDDESDFDEYDTASEGPQAPATVDDDAADPSDSEQEDEDDGPRRSSRTPVQRQLLSYSSPGEQVETALVGAGIGGGFSHTAELKPMKYNQAMAGSDRAEWEKSVDQEHDKMEKHGVFEEVPRSKVPPGAKILSTTWAMKQKANGVKRARMNARGFEQVDGEHYDADSISSPVVNALTIQIVMALIVIGDLYAALFDVAGAFLTSKLEANKQLYVEIPQGFEKFYGKDSVLRMIKALYGCKQSSKMFWQKLVSVLMSMGFKRSKADPCCYY